mgnify:CR=1 FL=1
MGYKAVDVARRMVQLSIENKLWITNLQLQKILYFTWIDYYKKGNGRLFEDKKFEAWKYGPVVKEVYYEYWLNVSRLIFFTKEPEEDMSDVSDFLLDSLKKYQPMKTSVLVDMAHEEGSPWADRYEIGKKEEIPFSLIERSASANSES